MQNPFQAGPPRGYGPPVSPAPFQQHQMQQQQQPPRTHTPPTLQHQPRSGSLPSAPGLPQRPSFGAPQVNAFQMQQMHQGQIPGPPNPADPRLQTGISQNGASAPPPSAPEDANAGQSLDDLISGAAKDAQAQAAAKTGEEPTDKKGEEPTEKKGKKEKGKATKLVYSDEQISPEEKMAGLSRYAFVPDRKPETVLQDANAASASTGINQDQDDVVDRME